VSIEVIGIIGAFLAGLGALIVSVRTSLHSVTQKELSSISAENDRLRKRIEILESKIADRDATIEKMRADWTHEVEAMQEQIRELQQENVILREQLAVRRKRGI